MILKHGGDLKNKMLKDWKKIESAGWWTEWQNKNNHARASIYPLSFDINSKTPYKTTIEKMEGVEVKNHENKSQALKYIVAYMREN